MIKFNCPSCGQVIEGPDEILLEEMVDCPTCEQRFKPLKIINPQPIGIPAMHPARLKQEAAKILPVIAPSDTDEIKTKANVFSLMAIVLAVIGVIGFFIGMSGDEDGWIIMGSCSGAALFLYLIAQIIHIRALLAKKS